MPQRSDGRHEPVHVRLPASTTSEQVPAPIAPPVTITVPQRRQQHDWSALSNYCPHGLNHRSVERILLHIIAQHYLEPVSISERTTPYTLVNHEDVYESRTIPVYVYALMDKRYTGRLPAIIVQRGEQSYQRLALDDRTAQPVFVTRGITVSSPQPLPPNYCRLVSGVHVCSCMSPSPGETDALAVELADYLTQVTPLVLEYVPFINFEVEKISPVVPTDASGGSFIAQVSLSYVYEHAWAVERTPHAVVDAAIDVNPR